MTNEEAVYNLLEIFDRYDIETGSVYGIAIQTAVKSLNTEPKFFPPCVDCNEKMDEIRRAYDNRLNWILLKDKLPINEEVVLVCTDIGEVDVAKFNENFVEISEICSDYIKTNNFCWSIGYGKTSFDGKIIAWMPLPKAYKENKDER